MHTFIYTFSMLFIPVVLMCQKQYRTRAVNESRINWSGWLVFVFVFTVLIRGLAWDTGADWMAYYNFAVDARKGFENEWAQHSEATFKYFVICLSKLHISDFLFFILASVLYVYSVLKISSLYGKAQPWIIIAWYLLLFNLSLNIYRQYVAMSFVMLAVWYFIHSKKNVALIFIVLSVLFHTSSIVAVPFILIAYGLSKRKISVYWWIGLIIASSVATNTFLRVFLGMSSGFQQIFLLGNSNSYNVLEFIDSTYGTTYIWVLMIVNSVLVYLSDKIKDKYKYYQFFHYQTVITCILIPLCDQELLSRILLYSKMFMPVTIGLVYWHYGRTKGVSRLMSFCIALTYIVLFYKSLMDIGENHPYLIKWDKLY